MGMNSWPTDISEARQIQDALSKQVKIIPLKKMPELIAGVDASIDSGKVTAVVSLYEYSGLRHIEDAFSVKEVRFPYIPGFLSFREGETVIDAIEKLRIKPDIILFDGQGIAHTKGIGIASHIGVILDMPSIGCAKSRLVGRFKEPAAEKGSWTYLYHNDRRVGVVLRTRSSVKPIFVSPGHRVDIDSSIKIVMKCVYKYRIPEPLRRADSLSREIL